MKVFNNRFCCGISYFTPSPNADSTVGNHPPQMFKYSKPCASQT